MEKNDLNYTCPFCRWNKSHSWTHFQEEEEVIDSQYLGQEFNTTYYLETKKKFKVKICSNCYRYLKIRTWIIRILLAIFCVCILIGFILSLINNWIDSSSVDKIGMYLVATGFIVGFVLFLFWILWKMLAPTRAHVSFERAFKCNAL